LKLLPSTVRVAGQLTADVGVSPARIRANEDTTLKVDPGANCPTVATDWSSLPGPLAAARIRPVDGWMATIALAGSTSSRISSARVCSGMLSVRLRSWPGTGLLSNTVSAGAGVGVAVGVTLGEGLGLATGLVTSRTTTPGFPRSRSS
jgi:hypothetical protein